MTNSGGGSFCSADRRGRGRAYLTKRPVSEHGLVVAGSSEVAVRRCGIVAWRCAISAIARNLGIPRLERCTSVTEKSKSWFRWSEKARSWLRMVDPWPMKHGSVGLADDLWLPKFGGNQEGGKLNFGALYFETK